MASILLIKYSLKTWLHRSTDKGDFILSRFTFTEDDQHFRAVELNGTERNRYHVSQVTIEDRSVSPIQTHGPYTSMTALSLKLEEMNYPPFQLGNATLLVNPGDITPDLVQDLQSVLNEGNVATGLPIKLTDGGTWTILNDDGTLTWANAALSKSATLDLSGRTNLGDAIFHTPNKDAGHYTLATLEDIADIILQPDNTAKGILIPFYLTPDLTAEGEATITELTTLMDAYPDVQVIAVINEANGAGTETSAVYEAFINVMHDHGGKVIGYVYTSGGERDNIEGEGTVNTEMLRWKNLYSDIDGIFLDEMGTDAELYLDTYGDWKEYANGLDLNTVVGNPGTGLDVAWFDDPRALDIYIIHENSAASPPTETELEEYDGFRRPPERAVLVHGQTAWNAANFNMIMRHAKWVYVTDNSDVDENPWDTISTYLPEMFAGTGAAIIGPPVDSYKKKNENADVIVRLDSLAAFLTESEASYLRIASSLTGTIQGIRVADTTHVYPGKEYTIKNETGAPLTIIHGYASGMLDRSFKAFDLPNAEDIVLENKECITVHYSSNTFQLISTNRIGSGEEVTTPDLQAVTDVGAVTDNEITIPSAYVPEGDGTEAYAKLTPRFFIVGDRGITGLGEMKRLVSAFAFPNEESFGVNTATAPYSAHLGVHPSYIILNQHTTSGLEQFYKEITMGGDRVSIRSSRDNDGVVDNVELVVENDQIKVYRYIDGETTKEVSLIIDNVTGARTLYTPDASGTIALEEWVTAQIAAAGGGASNLQAVTDEGASTTNDITVESVSGLDRTKITPTSLSVGNLGAGLGESYVSFFDAVFDATKAVIHSVDEEATQYSNLQVEIGQVYLTSSYTPEEGTNNLTLITSASDLATVTAYSTTGGVTNFMKIGVTSDDIRFDRNVAGVLQRLHLSLLLLSSERTLYAPDENGVIATQAYVDAAVAGGGGGGGTLDSVTDSGASTTNTITVGGVDVPVGDGEAVMARLTPTSLMLGDIGASGAGDWMKYFSVFDPNAADDAMELGYQDTEGFYTLRMAPWGYNVNHHTEEVADVTPLQSLFFSMQDGQIRMGAQSIQSYGTFHNRRLAFIIVPSTGFEFKDEVADKKVTLELDNLTANRTLQAPDESGIIATREWAIANIEGGGGGGTLDSVTDSGASTTNTITVGGVEVPGTSDNEAKITPISIAVGDGNAATPSRFMAVFDAEAGWAEGFEVFTKTDDNNYTDFWFDPTSLQLYRIERASAGSNKYQQQIDFNGSTLSLESKSQTPSFVDTKSELRLTPSMFQFYSQSYALNLIVSGLTSNVTVTPPTADGKLATEEWVAANSPTLQEVTDAGASTTDVVTVGGTLMPGTGDEYARLTPTSISVGDMGAAGSGDWNRYMSVFDPVNSDDTFSIYTYHTGTADYATQEIEPTNASITQETVISTERYRKSNLMSSYYLRLITERIIIATSAVDYTELQVLHDKVKFIREIPTDSVTREVSFNLDNLTAARILEIPDESGVIATQAHVTTAISTKADLVGGLVPSSQLPSYVDDVLEYANFASLPGTGTTGKIYITLDDNKQYRWSGSAYVQITNGLIASTTDVPEGSNLYFTESRVRAAVLTGLSTATNAVITAADTVLGALGKLQKQITDLMTSANIITALGYTPAKAYTPQMTISGNVTLDDTYNGAIVKVKATANITVPSTLSTDFSCTFVTFATYTGTFIQGSGATLTAPSGTTLAASKTATLFKDGSTTTYMLIGDLS